MACSILGCHHSHLWLVRISDWVSQCMIISVLPESYWPIRKTFEKKICLLLVPNLSVFPPSLFPPFIFFISFLCFLSPFLPSFTLFFPSHPPASFSPSLISLFLSLISPFSADYMRESKQPRSFINTNYLLTPTKGSSPTWSWCWRWQSWEMERM